MQKGVGFRVNLEVYDTTGIAVSGSHAVTAAISQNGSGYVTSTNTPVTASATYPQMVSFMLTDAEADADILHIIGGSLNCVIPPRTFYPEAVYTSTKAGYMTGPIALEATSQTITGVINTNLDAPVSSRTACAIWTDTKAAYIAVPLTSLALSGTALSNTDWTVARATNLDAPISSRALSGTALSSDQWTNALTGVITTNLDTTISSRASATGVTVSSITSGVLFSIASELLTVDWNDITDTVAARSVLNALRALRNKISISGTTLTITEEDDATPAWTATGVEAPGATPFSEIDPA